MAMLESRNLPDFFKYLLRLVNNMKTTETRVPIFQEFTSLVEEKNGYIRSQEEFPSSVG